MGKFKVDENLPIDVVAVLAQAGHDALTVLDQQLGGQPDPSVAAVCQQESRVLLTLDLDFADIRTYPPANYAGIVVLRLNRLDKTSILAVIRRLLPIMENESISGKLWIVNESRIRIRE